MKEVRFRVGRWWWLVVVALLAGGLGATARLWPGRATGLPPVTLNTTCGIDGTGQPVDPRVCGAAEVAGREEAWEAVPASEGEVDEALRRRNAFLEQRAYPLTSVAPDARLKALVQSARMPRTFALTAGSWQLVGPAPMRNSYMGGVPIDVSGRVTALAVDPSDTSGNTVYLGAAQGGVWKTTDGGATWVPLTDKQASLAIGAIALAPSNPKIIYVGTGEPNSGLDCYYGAGILKSTDGGTTWTRLGANEFTGAGISSIVVDPDDPNRVYVASSAQVIPGPQFPTTGIFRSTDGGSTWTPLLGCRGCSASDLVMSPLNKNVLYAAFHGIGIYKSTDGGDNWTKISSWVQFTFRRIELGIGAKNGQDYLYAGFHVTIQGQYDGPGLFYSKDGGATWSQFPTPYPNYCTQQCWYDNVIGVDPNNADVIYVGGSAAYNFRVSPPTVKQVFVKHTDGGQSTTWYDLSPQTSGASQTLHPDAHAIAFGPDGSVWVGTDGGVARSRDGGATWEHRNTNLATLQFTGIAVHPTNPNIVFGGMQDNNKAVYSGSGTAWDARDAGDGGFAAIDPFDPKYFYGSRFGISFQRNDQGGANPNAPNWMVDWPVKTNGIDPNDRALFYAPFALDPSTAGVIYFGTYRLYRTADRGETWTAISGDLTGSSNGRISAIAVAPSASGTVYVGSSDGRVHVTANAGTGNTFVDVTKAPLPGRYVTDFAIDPTNDQIAYVTFSGFNTHTPGEPGHVFKTTDRGNTWVDVSGNLPDIPVSSIVLDGNTLYVGTDTGVYVSTSGGTAWEPFNNGLPLVAVVDLVLFKSGSTKILYAATHGRSVWRTTLSTAPKNYRLFLPLVLRNYVPSAPPPTSTPTVTPSVTPVPGSPTPTPTPRQTFDTPTPTSTPTSTPTPTPTQTGPTPTPTPTQNPSLPGYPDPFDNADNGWYTGSAAGGYCQFELNSGAYGITAYSQYACWDVADQGSTLITGTFEVKAEHYDAGGSGGYGLVLGSNAAMNRFYTLLIDPLSQQFSFQFYDGGFPATSQWITSTAINATGVNTIKVRRSHIADQSAFVLYVNGQYLAAYADTDLTPGEYFGLLAYDSSGNWSLSGFDDYAVARETLLYAHDFSDPVNGWPTGSTPGNSCAFSYEGGEYRVDAAADYACLAIKGEAKNATYEVKARRGTLEGSYSYSVLYGLLFAGDASFSRFYTLWVEPDSQMVAAYKYISPTWYYLGEGWITATQAISPGMGVNRIRAEQNGPYIAVQINGHYVDMTPSTTVGSDYYLYDPSYNSYPPQGNYYGLVTVAFPSSSVTTYYDDYKVIGWQTLEMSRPVAEAPVVLRSLPVPPALRPSDR